MSASSYSLKKEQHSEIVLKKNSNILNLKVCRNIFFIRLCTNSYLFEMAYSLTFRLL